MKPSNRRLTRNESTEKLLRKIIGPLYKKIKVIGSKLDQIATDIDIIKQSVASTKKTDGKCTP